MPRVSNIVILTGAGISVESGLPAFRTVNGQTCWDTGATVHPLEDFRMSAFDPLRTLVEAL